MPNFNKVFIMGNMTRDPEVRSTSSGTTVVGFTLAVNRKYKPKDGEAVEETAFIDCTAWARTGEVIAQYCTKGSPLLVEGRLKQDRWEDKATGAKRSKLGVVVDTFQFVGRGQDSSGADAESSTPAPAQKGGDAGSPPSGGSAPSDDFDIEDDKVPF